MSSRVVSNVPFFPLPYILEAIPRCNTSDLLWGMPQMKQSIHLNRAPWDWRPSDWLLEDWQVSTIFHRKVAGSPLCDMEACGGLLSIFLSMCLFFSRTPLLFKQASEHLNDQNSATWLSAPALSNLDGYVSASERGRHWRYTYYYTDAHARTHTHAFAHESSVVSLHRLTPLGIPGSWARQKSGKMCSSVGMQSVRQLSKTSSYLFS